MNLPEAGRGASTLRSSAWAAYYSLHLENIK